MLPKRQNIGRHTNKAKRQRVQRMNEFKEEHTQRVESIRLQQSQSCSNETAEQHEARIAQNRIRIAQKRSRLSYAAKNVEHENNRLRMQLIQSNQIEKLKDLPKQCAAGVPLYHLHTKITNSGCSKNTINTIIRQTDHRTRQQRAVAVRVRITRQMT